MVSHAIFILPASRLRVDQEADGLPILRGWIAPVFFDGVPELPEAFVVGVAILHDQRLDAFRMSQREAITDRCPVIHHVDRVPGESKFIDQRFHHVGQVFETVVKIIMTRHTALAEPGIVGCHYVE